MGPRICQVWKHPPVLWPSVPMPVPTCLPASCTEAKCKSAHTSFRFTMEFPAVFTILKVFCRSFHVLFTAETSRAKLVQSTKLDM